MGVDTTLLRAASSFLNPSESDEDPRACDSFIRIATEYCNGAKLVLPLPQNSLGNMPMFCNLWKRNRALTAIEGRELSDDLFAKIAAARSEDFAAWVEGEPGPVAHWIAFQFSPEVSDAYLSRTNTDAIKRCASIVLSMVKENKFLRLQNAIDRLWESKSISRPKFYDALIHEREIPSFHHLCIAYALSIALRGYAYALALGAEEHPALYCHHWIRSKIIGDFEAGPIPVQITSHSELQFPWGEILANVFDREKPLVNRTTEKITDILEGIRNKAGVVQHEIKNGLLCSSASDGENDNTRVSDAEVFILDLLNEVGVSPRYGESGRLQRLVKFVRLASHHSPLVKVAIETLIADMQPQWIRKKETMYRAHERFCFKRDSFWKVMEDPGIQRAIHMIEKK